MTPILVFDIETVPDVAGYRSLEKVPAEVTDAEVAEMAFHQRRAQTGSDFLPLHLQRVVAISCVLRSGDSWKVWWFGPALLIFCTRPLTSVSTESLNFTRREACVPLMSEKLIFFWP